MDGDGVLGGGDGDAGNENQETAGENSGLAASSGGFMVDARFTYRFTYNDQLLGNADMGNWVVSANVGREF